ncbi:type II CAAX prenyl endopeptidase Rce1 family protein [Actinoalloteichus caeruleus]|uniref:CPBP family glutamic-type intramembrane protease n=1 Tax=Actinoalloteichus cyanogriseus TaxID=2893586 RepID=UPI0004AB5033|nr:CPBP family glutamic-type intramembrane protease [Actinoalloteichus caeruleus]
MNQVDGGEEPRRATPGPPGHGTAEPDETVTDIPGEERATRTAGPGAEARRDGGPPTAEPRPDPGADGAPVRTHRWGLGVFFLAQLVFLLSSVFLVAPLGPMDPDSSLRETVLIVGLVLPTLLAAGVVLAATRLRGNGPRRDLGLEWSWADVRTGLKYGALCMGLAYVGAMFWSQWVGEENANSAVGSLVEGLQLSPGLAVLLFLHVFLIAPTCEELIFRGALWGAMERLRWSRWAVFVSSTAIFAVAHLEPERTPLLLLIGIPIALARLYTGRLLASIVAHQMNNLLGAVGLLLMALGVIPP